MLKILSDIAIKKSYWVSLIVFSMVLELVALYYQYGLDEWPCVLCIHVRIWLLVLIVVAAAALFVKKISAIAVVAHSAVTILFMILLERSWVLLGVERGTIFGSCDMDLGLPWWFEIDKWFPHVFEVKTACGYTPVLFSGVTMAEALMLFSSLLLLLSISILISLLWALKNKDEHKS